MVGIVNGCIRFMMTDGHSISWWLNSMSDNTIQNLHKYWAMGMFVLEALGSGRYFNQVALASLLTVSITIIDGPLLQRAISPVNRNFTANTSISAQLAQEPLPSGFSGYSSHNSENYFLNSVFKDVVSDYQRRAPIQLRTNATGGLFETTLLGPGFDISCSNETKPLHVLPGNSSLIMWLNFTADPQRYNGLIDINFGSTNGSSALSNEREGLSSCDTFLYTKSCHLHYAKVSYSIILANNTATLRDQSSTENRTIDLLYLKNEITFIRPDNPSTLGGLLGIARELWNAQSEANVIGTQFPQGYVALTYNNPGLATAIEGCGWKWNDPTEDVFNGIRELMFRSAISATPQNATQQVVPATMSYSQTVYQAHMHWYFAALALILTNILALLPLFIGYWKLGRKVTLSPIETAKAFEAPLLHNGSSAVPVNRLLKSVGSQKVKYGEELGSEAGAAKLRIGDAATTVRFRNGQVSS